jgi:hypothetical protein
MTAAPATEQSRDRPGGKLTGARDAFEHAENDGFEHKPDKEFGHSSRRALAQNRSPSCTGT